MAPTSTLRSLTVLIVAALTIAAASIGLVALAFGGDDLAADAQTEGCWTTVWGTDNDGYFFSIIAGEGCPDYRGRVFAGAFQRGPTIASRDGVAKMTGIDACTYDTVEVKAVERIAERVLYRFTWTAEHLGCGDATPTTSTSTSTPGPTTTSATTTTTAPAEAAPDSYVPFPGALVRVTERADGCELTVTGSGNTTYDLTLNGIAKLVNGTTAAEPHFSLWISPEGGNRWSAGAFHAASLTEDCAFDVHRNITEPPPPADDSRTPSTQPAPTTTVAATTSTTVASTTTIPAPHGSDTSYEIDLGDDVISVTRCGREFGADLVCIRELGGAWINVDAYDGYGRFDHLDANTVVYALEGDLLKIGVRTESRTNPVVLELSFG
jgi:hypothetical protein